MRSASPLSCASSALTTLSIALEREPFTRQRTPACSSPASAATRATWLRSAARPPRRSGWPRGRARPGVHRRRPMPRRAWAPMSACSCRGGFAEFGHVAQHQPALRPSRAAPGSRSPRRPSPDWRCSCRHQHGAIADEAGAGSAGPSPPRHCPGRQRSRRRAPAGTERQGRGGERIHHVVAPGQRQARSPRGRPAWSAGNASPRRCS